MGQKKVAEILCRRDGMTMEEAMELVEMTAVEITGCNYMDEVEDIIMNNLGLEMDYIFDIIAL